MPRDDIKTFPLLHPQSGGDGTPYDTYRLRRLYDAAATLHRWGGSDVSISFRGGDIGDGIPHRWSRPIASVSGFVTVLVVPVIISEGLKTLHITHDVAVGIGPYAREGISYAVAGGSWITVRAHLASDPGRAAYRDINGVAGIVGDPWRYQHAHMALDVSGTPPGPDVLIISMKSRLPDAYMDPVAWWGGASDSYAWPPGVIDHSGFLTSSEALMIRTGTQSREYGVPLYQEAPPPAMVVPSGAISSWDLGTTATILVGGDGITYATPQVIRAVDHIRTSPDERGAYFWPPQEDISDIHVKRVARGWIPWGVWRGISIKEEFSPLAYPQKDDLRSGGPASASSYRAVRRALRRAHQRPRLLWVGNPGVFPLRGGSGAWWHQRGRTMRHIPQMPKYSYKIPVSMTPPWGAGQLRARLLVAGVYQGDQAGGTWKPKLEFDTWDDALKSGATGIVGIAGTAQKINFAALGLSKNSHFLTAKSLQIGVGQAGYPYTTCDAGSGHVLREGLLTDEDLGIWQTIDVPIESVDDLVFDWADTEESLRWATGPSSGVTGKEAGGVSVPDVERCVIFILGFSIYWTGA